jgi:hypothetical protein
MLGAGRECCLSTPPRVRERESSAMRQGAASCIHLYRPETTPVWKKSRNPNGGALLSVWEFPRCRHVSSAVQVRRLVTKRGVLALN